MVSALLILLASLVGLLMPWPLKFLVDSVLGEEPTPWWVTATFGKFASDRYAMMYVAVIAGLGVTLLSDLVHVLSNYAQTKLEQLMVLDVRSDLFEHSQRLSVSYHEQKRSGMLIYIINSLGDAVVGVLMTIPPLVQSVLTLIGMFIVSMTIDPWLALVSLVVVPFLYYSVGYYAKHIQSRLYEVRGLEGETLSVIHEAISMIRVILAFGRSDHESHRHRKLGLKAIDARVKITIRQTLFTMAVNAITAGGTALVLAVGARHALSGKLTVGQLLVVLAYIASVYKPLESISYTIGGLQDKFVNLGIAFGLLDTEPDIKDSPNARAIDRVRGAVRFDNVKFSYPGREDTLKDVSIDVKPGEVVAIVGPTGAGKSTLISLLPRFYDPDGGRIEIDGINIHDITLKSLRHQIALVQQEPLLFSGSIMDNIRYGRLEATDEEVVNAAKAANAHDFVERLPEGYRTELGERGTKVSGGERQRIAIARAFLKDAPILILDEPTSAIDSKTEQVILDALDRLMVGRTTFIIAHRLSTIRHADQIVAIEAGRVVESGTHDALLLRNGLYRQLYDIQTGKRRRQRDDDAIVNPTEVNADTSNSDEVAEVIQ